MIEVIHLSPGKSPFPFSLLKRLAEHVLGRSYNLSVVICGDKLSAKLNHRLGKKNPANVLSFPLSKSSGEIFLNSIQAGREAKDFGRSKKEHLIRLFIHGLCHLKGLRHGRKMEEAEEKLWWKVKD